MRLSQLLRHTVCSEMDEEGWMLVEDVARLLNIPEDDVIDVAIKDTKSRFEICYDPITKIRARHGHSIDLQRPAWMSRPITDAREVPYIMHTTTHENWELIKADGFLRPMGRQAIHFATHASLLRHRPVTIRVDMQRALAVGIMFYWSTDKIIVCPEPIPIHLLTLPHASSS